MSRGPGKLQRNILKYLNESGKAESCWTLCHVAHFDKWDQLSDYPDLIWQQERTKSNYKSTLRALKSLEKQGLVIGEKKEASWRTHLNASWYKVYMLTPRTNFHRVNT